MRRVIPVLIAFAALVPSASAATSTSVCGSSALTGPATRPAGAVSIPAGLNTGAYNTPNTTYYFESGVHTLGNDRYAQIDPGEGDTYVGAPGAILSGGGVNESAFAQTASNVTIEHLTIQGFVPPGGQGAVNHDSGPGWTIASNTIRDNAPGAGTMLGTRNRLRGNCLTRNGEYGFNAYASNHVTKLTGGPSYIAVLGNEISFNDTCNWELASPNPVPSAQRPAACSGAGQFEGCGCSGGGKFWETYGARIRGNDVHDNYNTGLWADTNNTGFVFDYNRFTHNWAEGLMYELGYNASITRNSFTGNAWGAGASNPGFPTGAVYVSEAGGDPRVSGGDGTFRIANNRFTDNWSGVVLWENADRFCGNTLTSNAEQTCTLVKPSLYYDRSDAPETTPKPGGCGQFDLTGASAGALTGSPAADYYDNCRWKTQNVSVTGNSFAMTPSSVPGCRGADNSCGVNAIFSQYGTSPSWSPYHGEAIPTAIATRQNNLFRANTYTGAWSFVFRDQGNELSFAQWRAQGQDA